MGVMKKSMYRIGMAVLLCLSLMLPMEVAAQGAPFYGYRPPAYRPLVVRDEGDAARRQNAVFPEKFDLRLNRVSPVKDQNINGDCWSFATMGALESHLLPGRLYDFSEKHLVDHVGFENVKSVGGNMQMAQAYLARAAGPVDEADDPYNSQGEVNGLEPVVYLRTAYSVAKEDIKEALIRYGAVQTAIYADDDNIGIFNKKHSAQYVNYEPGENHEVVIVGWDDAYPKEKFSVPPKKNGAWIVKNSWGENWGDQGYYYVSYEDLTIGKDNMVYVDVAESKWYDQLYEYDEYGRIGTYGYPDAPYNWFSNVFTVKGAQERIKAVSFYTNEPGIEYDLYVDTNFNGRFNLRRVGGGQMEYSGYHTVDLPREELVTGGRFAVAVRIRTKHELPIAVEYSRPNYLHLATANPNESFVSTDGQEWTDLQRRKGWNVCLKAFTVGADVPQPPVDPQPSTEPQELKEATWYTWAPHIPSITHPAKIWRVRFNQNLDERSINGQVRVFDVSNYQPVDVSVQMSNSGREVIVSPNGAYSPGEYILYIGKVRSVSGKELRPMKAKFRVN